MDLNTIIMENIENVDITEPAAMDMLLVRLEEIEQENETFMELLLNKLDNMIITWEQPWYQQTNCVTRPVNVENDDDNGGDNKKETFRTDSFTEKESKILQKNWKMFRKAFQLPDKPICIARWRNKERKHPTAPQEKARHFVISYLAQGLKRNLYQVYRHFITVYGGPVKGPYTKQEEKIVEICFRYFPNNLVVNLSALLSREPRNIYKRIHVMFNGKPEAKKRIKWILPLATEFLKKLMTYSECPLQELKNRKIELSVWHKLQEDLDQPYYKLQTFWYRYLHVALFVKCDVKLAKLEKKLMGLLQSNPSYQVWSDIRWNDVVKKLPDGFTPIFLRRVTYRLVKSFQRKDSKWLKDPLTDVISHTLHQLDVGRKRKYRLKTLTLNSEGMLEPIKYGVKMDFE